MADDYRASAADSAAGVAALVVVAAAVDATFAMRLDSDGGPLPCGGVTFGEVALAVGSWSAVADAPSVVRLERSNFFAAVVAAGSVDCLVLVASFDSGWNQSGGVRFVKHC